MDDAFWDSLPPELDAATYRLLHADLAEFSDQQLEDHYQRYGRTEGRVANGIPNREAFAALIPATASVLEIGPFCSPVMRGPNVAYLDVMPRTKLIERAKEHRQDPAGIPEIDYVSPTGDLSIVDRQFDFILSSHSIEHQPDIVRHLQQVRQALRPGGGYFALIPDKRYCFDHFIPESGIAEIIVAHRERRVRHSLRSVIEHRALITHNDADRHWRGDHGPKYLQIDHRVAVAVREYEASPDRYIDVHAWYFTPESCADIICGLRDLRLSDFSVHRLYPTRRGAGEFWIILRGSLGKHDRQ